MYHTLALREKRWFAFNHWTFNAVQRYKLLCY